MIENELEDNEVAEKVTAYFYSFLNSSVLKSYKIKRKRKKDMLV